MDGAKQAGQLSPAIRFFGVNEWMNNDDTLKFE